MNLATLTARYTSTALAFIQKVTSARADAASSKMFALYYAFDHVHTPQFGTCGASSTTCTSSPRGPFGDALLQVDRAVGEVMHAIRQLKPSRHTTEEQTHVDEFLGEHTLLHGSETFVFLTSDNGAPSGGQVIAGLNAPFTGK